MRSSVLSLLLVWFVLQTAALAETASVAKDGPAHEPRNTLRGEISLDIAPDPVTKCMNDLTDVALANDENIKKINAYVERFKGFKHSLVHRSKDALNYVFLYKGVSQSSEASDIILDEKQKLKGRSSAEYLRQKLIDRTDMTVTKSVLELAMGIGNTDSEAGAEQIKAASQTLKGLVGQEKTDETIEFLKKMAAQNPVAPETWQQKPWSISQKSDREKYLAEVSVATDPVCQQIVTYLHKYNNVSAVNRSSQKIVRTTLSLAALSPTLVAPAAQAAIFAWVMASGGSEEDKLLKEVYLAKSLEMKNKSICEKANLALEFYQMSLMTKNPALLQCCRSMVKRMAGDQSSANLLNEGVFVSQKPAKEEEISLADESESKPKRKRRIKKQKTASVSIDDETSVK